MSPTRISVCARKYCWISVRWRGGRSASIIGREKKSRKQRRGEGEERRGDDDGDEGEKQQTSPFSLSAFGETRSAVLDSIRHASVCLGAWRTDCSQRRHRPRWSHARTVDDNRKGKWRTASPTMEKEETPRVASSRPEQEDSSHSIREARLPCRCHGGFVLGARARATREYHCELNALSVILMRRIGA